MARPPAALDAHLNCFLKGSLPPRSASLHDKSLEDQLQALLVMHILRVADQRKQVCNTSQSNPGHGASISFEWGPHSLGQVSLGRPQLSCAPVQDARRAKRAAAEQLVPATPSKRLTLLQIAPALALPHQAARLPMGQLGYPNANPLAPAALTAPPSAGHTRERMQQHFTSGTAHSAPIGNAVAGSGQQEPSMHLGAAQRAVHSSSVRTWMPPSDGATTVTSYFGSSSGKSGGGGGSALVKGLASNGFTILVPPQRGASPPPPAAAAERPSTVLRAAVQALPAHPTAPLALGCSGKGVPAVGGLPGKGSAVDGDSAVAAATATRPAVLPEQASLRVNRRNIVQRLAELGSPPQQVCPFQGGTWGDTMSNILLTGAACDIHSCTVSVTWLCVGSFKQCTE